MASLLLLIPASNKHHGRSVHSDTTNGGKSNAHSTSLHRRAGGGTIAQGVAAVRVARGARGRTRTGLRTRHTIVRHVASKNREGRIDEARQEVDGRAKLLVVIVVESRVGVQQIQVKRVDQVTRHVQQGESRDVAQLFGGVVRSQSNHFNLVVVNAKSISNGNGHVGGKLPAGSVSMADNERPVEAALETNLNLGRVGRSGRHASRRSDELGVSGRGSGSRSG